MDLRSHVAGWPCRGGPSRNMFSRAGAGSHHAHAARRDVCHAYRRQIHTTIYTITSTTIRTHKQSTLNS
eukprot:365607-Chlamydomonas_euryale.AAC.11